MRVEPPPEAARLIESLDLAPHPEGGWYRETWRGSPSESGRAVGTAIYYVVVAGAPSRLHRVDADEVFHWYGGHPVELLRLGPDGRSEVVTLGADEPQTVVPRDWWQASASWGPRVGRCSAARSVLASSSTASSSRPASRRASSPRASRRTASSSTN